MSCTRCHAGPLQSASSPSCCVYARILSQSVMRAAPSLARKSGPRMVSVMMVWSEPKSTSSHFHEISSIQQSQDRSGVSLEMLLPLLVATPDSLSRETSRSSIVLTKAFPLLD
ncbi:hypothetical protein HPB49_009722 [Dermacentor silvarum]|uniref:Uncharacterized protein n=1 Tax=Dermacentor silvarum TaxID=543639 RepID=A0ACB8CE63_DERSI|nr:hypothetical protein HPB49_009722 [Dermacentor silvarum]